jgi:hypothetical protein
VIRVVTNRVFWAGVFVPLAIVAAVLVYSVVHSSSGTNAYAANNTPSRGPSSPTQAETASPVNEPTISAASSMSALNSTPTVGLPDSLANAVSAINSAPPSAPASEVTGSVAPAQAHLLLSGVGSLGVSIYAAKTDAGRVCIFDTHGPAGCSDQFTSTVPVVWQGEVTQSGKWTHIAGLAPDRIQAITLQNQDGSTQQATLRNNAFYVEPDGDPTALVLTYRDGSTQTDPIPGPPPPPTGP